MRLKTYLQAFIWQNDIFSAKTRMGIELFEVHFRLNSSSSWDCVKKFLTFAYKLGICSSFILIQYSYGRRFFFYVSTSFLPRNSDGRRQRCVEQKSCINLASNCEARSVWVSGHRYTRNCVRQKPYEFRAI